MSSKIANLQNALTSARSGSVASAVPTPKPANTVEKGDAKAPKRQANRVGTVNIAAWMDPAFKQSLRLVQARRGGTISELMAEAFNDLFAKYDVPQVRTKD